MISEKINFLNFNLEAGQALPTVPAIEKRDVHLWFFPLVATEANVNTLKGWLSKDEIERAQRFKNSAKARQFIVSHALQRQILAVYLKTEPEKIVFDLTEAGKPFIRDCSISHNISHSGDYCLLAITKNRAIGVDIELKRTLNLAAIAKRYFSNAEIEFLAQQKEAEKLNKFFEIWCYKEAFIKANALKLADAISNVVTKPHNHQLTVDFIDTHVSNKNWQIQAFDFAPNLVAIVIVQIFYQDL